jgi:hypothetical protein
VISPRDIKLSSFNLPNIIEITINILNQHTNLLVSFVYFSESLYTVVVGLAEELKTNIKQRPKLCPACVSFACSKLQDSSTHVDEDYKPSG